MWIVLEWTTGNSVVALFKNDTGTIVETMYLTAPDKIAESQSEQITSSYALNLVLAPDNYDLEFITQTRDELLFYILSVNITDCQCEYNYHLIIFTVLYWTDEYKIE